MSQRSLPPVRTARSARSGSIEFDPAERFCYYYAHLDRYADGLHEGQRLRRGEFLGYVGSTGNASEDAPHLHLALIRLDADKRGTYVNPYPLLAGPQRP